MKPTKSKGEKALESISGLIYQIATHQGSASNLRGMAVWLPRWLQPTTSGDYYPINSFGYRIGSNEPVTPNREWIIHSESINLDGLRLDTNDPDAWVDLFDGLAPWKDETNKGVYLNRLAKVFGINLQSVNRKARGHAPLGVIAGA